MAMSIEERLDSVEYALKELAYAGRRTEMSLDRLSVEMREFKSEMAAFKDEMRHDRKTMNRTWGDLANRWGTFTEDVVLPNFPHVLKRYFGVTEIEMVLPRPRVKLGGSKTGRMKEFDLVAWTAGSVFWTETKSHGTMSDFRDFLADDSFFHYFPALAGRTLIRIASALYFSPESVAALTRRGGSSLEVHPVPRRTALQSENRDPNPGIRTPATTRRCVSPAKVRYFSP